MKKLVAVVLAASITLTAASTALASGPAEVTYGVNFRKAPSTDSKVIRMLKRGESIQVLDEHNQYWLKVKTSSGQVGYISSNSKYTKYTGSSQNTSPSKPSNANSAASKADAIIATADSLVNRATYVYGVRNHDKLIFDCSSFTQYVFGKHGVDLKWGTRYQKNAGTFVSKSNLKKGDLVFFSLEAGSKNIGHVGIYVGNHKFIHILKDKKSDVQYDNLNKGYWKDRYVTARRVL